MSWGQQKVGWGRPYKPMSFTYSQLMQRHRDALAADSSKESLIQIERNHRSALTGFLKFLGKHETSNVGLELTTDFAPTVSKYLSSLESISERTKSDRRSLLNAWRNTFVVLGDSVDTPVRGREVRSQSSPAAISTPFHERLREALDASGYRAKAAALASKTSASAISRWMRGAHPSKRSLPNLHKLEKLLSVPEGELFALASEGIKRKVHIPTDPFRKRLAELVKEKYRLKISEVTPKFREQWLSLFRYKTSATAPRGLNRHTKARWSLTPIEKSTIAPDAFNSQGTSVSAAANQAWTLASRFFGFLQLHIDRGGYGLAEEDAQNLAWLAVPDAIERFLEFVTERSDGLKHGGHRQFCSLVSTMTHGKHGYLSQQPAFSSTLPNEVLEGWSWTEMCVEAGKLAAAWKADSTDQSRDTSAPLQHFFEHECALEPVLSAMYELRREANNSRNGSQEAIHRRDEVLLGLLASNPLRAKNIITLTYNVNNTGDVYKDAAGAWRVRISGGMFKNKNRVAKDTYDVAVATWLTPLFDDYIREFRPRLLKDGLKSGYFFLSKHGKRFDSMNRRVLKVTRKHIPDSGGVSPHAFRHLVATDWLNAHPNDFATVALLLNDTISVVMDNYAHLKKDIAFNKYSDYLAGVKKSKNL